MKTDLLPRIKRIISIFLAGSMMMACGEDNPDNPEPPGPASEEVVVHNFSDDKSKVEVHSIEPNDDGNLVLTIDCPSNEVPKVGEYLVSEPTELAPYGYLLRVVKVTEDPSTKGGSDVINEIKAKIETVRAGINEVIRNININKLFYIPLPDVCFEDFAPIIDGLKFTFDTSYDDTEIDDFAFDSDGRFEYVAGWVSEDDGVKKKKGNKATLSFDGFEIDGIKLKPDFSFTQKGLFFYLQILEGTFQKIGFDYEANLTCSLELESTYKGKLLDKKWLIGSLVESIIVPAGEVPIVVTFVFPLTIELKIDGSIGFTFKPLDVDYDISLGTYYDFPRKDFFPFWNHEKIVNIKDNTSQKEYFGIGEMGSELTMKGSLSLDISTGVSVGLYGCNIIDRKAGWMIDGKGPDGKPRSKLEKKLMKAFKDDIEAEFMVDTKGDINAKLEIGSVDEVAADFYVNDNCGFKWDWGVKLAGSFKIPFLDDLIPEWADKITEYISPDGKPLKLGSFTPSWDSPRGTIYDTAEDIRWPHTLFFSGYSDLKVEEMQEASEKSKFVVSVNKSKPLFGYHPYAERSFGLYFVPSDKKNDAMGTSSPYWKQYDLSGKSDYIFEQHPRWFEIREEIPKSDFEKGRYYDVYTYTEIDGPVLGRIFLFRTNKQFFITESGGLSTVDLEDVPGENL